VARGETVKRLGQGARRSLCASLCRRIPPVPHHLLKFYRALTHNFAPIPYLSSNSGAILSCTFSWLSTSTTRPTLYWKGLLSTHLIYRDYRASTHISTVVPPTIYIGMFQRLAQLAPKLPLSPHLTWPTRFLTTVLSPTFLPAFQSLCYRSFTHAATVPWPTKKQSLTVPSPPKLATKHLNSHRTRQCKDVFKICLKKTSGLMMIFILKFFSPNRRRTTQ
jgi:hypothetical protein